MDAAISLHMAGVASGRTADSVCPNETFSRKFFRKKLKTDVFYTGLERLGRDDYVNYISSPRPASM